MGDYDAGLSGNYGGGNVDWWWDYMRDEIGRNELASNLADALIHEEEAHAETQAALRAFIADLDKANAALALAKEALATRLAEDGERVGVQRVEHSWPERCWVARIGPFRSEADARAALDAINELEGEK